MGTVDMTLLFVLMGVTLGVVSASKMPGCPPLAGEAVSFLQVEAPEHYGSSQVDSCSFCRAVIAGRTDPCLGKADATTCRNKVIDLRSHCQKLVVMPCCKKPEAVDPEKEQGCVTVACSAVTPRCDAGSKPKSPKDWKGCCFSMADDCTTDFCTVENGGCSPNAMCSHMSKVQCSCNAGYKGDGTQCTEVNNCASNHGGCADNADCIQTGPGNHFCKCMPGFEGNGTKGGGCSAIDLCRTGVCDVLASCSVPKPGNFECECRDGYQGNGTVGNCHPINPCFENNGGCPKTGAVCVMTAPGKAECRCLDGFSGDGKICTPVDLCANGNNGGCSSVATCHMNGPGDRQCSCNTGYEGNGFQCEEFDNCASELLHGCDENAFCTKTGMAKHTCTCKRGYTGAGTKGTCTLLPPCAAQRDFGGCDVRFGQSAADVVDAIPKADVIYPGREIPKSVRQAIDEKFNERPMANCTEVDATAVCECLPGRFQDANKGDRPGTNCTPVNNCLAAHRGGCHPNATCIYAGPGVNLCQCKVGFKGNGQGASGFVDDNGVAQGCMEVNPCMEMTDGCDENACCTFFGPPKARNGQYLPEPLYGGKPRPLYPEKAVGEVYNCTCDPGYFGNGTTCLETCKIGPADCIHGSEPNPNMTSGLKQDCNCVQCLEPWFGDLCANCSLSQANCSNGGKFNAEFCKCEECDAPWGGSLCDKCQRKNADCANGGHINNDTCQCEGCKRYHAPHDPNGLRPKPVEKWAGELCDVCMWDEDTCVHTIIKDQKLKREGVTGNMISTVRSKEEIRVNQWKVEECRCHGCAYPWKGELCEVCGLQRSDCHHGGRLNIETCQCENCHSPWEGTMCHECGWAKLCNGGENGAKELDTCPCKHGSTLDARYCHCRRDKKAPYSEPWGGATFESCFYDKQDCNKGILDRTACKCIVCPSWWTGPLCDVCTRTQKDCSNGGQFDAAQCQCLDCNAPWAGDLCTICDRAEDECENGSELNTATCKCVEPGKTKCPHPWTGDTCGGCPLRQADCLHGGILNKEACGCEMCSPWAGSKCHLCVISDKDCAHGTVADKVNCRCKHPAGTDAKPCGPDSMWGGVKCNQCHLNHHVNSDGKLVTDCQNGAVLNREMCKCVAEGAAEGECPGAFKGVLCDKCSTRRLFEGDVEGCQNGGTLDQSGQASDKGNGCQCVNCDEGWAGDKCDQCQRNTNDCKHGTVLDAETCKCKVAGGVGCPMPWHGVHCETCGLSAASCRNGGTFNAVACQCQCKGGSEGVFCEILTCPKNCNGHGVCKGSTCECNTGWHNDGPDNPCSKTGTRSGRCRAVGDPHPQTFDGQSYDTYERGEFMYYKDVQDPWEEEIHGVHTMLARSTRAGMSGMAFRRKESEESTTVDTVSITSCEGNTYCSDDLAVQYNCDWYDSENKDKSSSARSWHDKVANAGSKGFVFPNGIKVVKGNPWRVSTPGGVEMQASFWGSGGGGGKYSRYWNMYMTCALPKDGRTRGACGNYDGNGGNDAQYLTEQYKDEWRSHRKVFSSPSDLSVNMDYDATISSATHPFGKTNTGSMKKVYGHHTAGGEGDGRYRSIMQCRSGPSGWDVKKHVCFDCPGDRGNSLSGIITAGPVSFLETKSTQKSLLSKRGKPCNASVPTNGKTDIEAPGLTQFCLRPSQSKAGFSAYSLCSCGGSKFASQVAVTTCAPCCPGMAKAKKGASAEGCYDCIQDFCGTGSAMMANTCANAQDADAENAADVETEKILDAAAKRSLDKKVAQEAKNLKVTELEDEVEVLEASSDSDMKARRLL